MQGLAEIIGEIIYRLLAFDLDGNGLPRMPISVAADSEITMFEAYDCTIAMLVSVYLMNIQLQVVGRGWDTVLE